MYVEANGFWQLRHMDGIGGRRRKQRRGGLALASGKGDRFLIRLFPSDERTKQSL